MLLIFFSDKKKSLFFHRQKFSETQAKKIRLQFYNFFKKILK